MIFKAFLKSAGERPGMLNTAVKEFLDMVGHCHVMYGQAGLAIWGLADVEQVRREVMERDILVNQSEREVRKAIVGHLAVNPSLETTLCLILMSVAKDVERIGDYCKNMMDLPGFHVIGGDDNALVLELKRLQKVIDAFFPDVSKAFRESDETLGGSLLKREREVTRACDRALQQILDMPELTNRQVVAYTLAARYYKRIAAHLGNVASSLVMPLHKLDYFDEDYLPHKTPDES